MQQSRKILSRVGLALLMLISVSGQAQQPRFLSLAPPEGLSIVPIMEGWVANPDGTKRTHDMKKAFVLAFTALFITELSMALEEPKYTVIETDDMFELRSYEPLIVAQTLVSGDMDGASNAGFKLIAGYIFGGNVSKNAAKKGDNDKISMTA